MATSSFSSDGSKDDLRSALTCKPDVNSDAFDALYERILGVREEAESMLGRTLSPGIEATYVIYPPGGYYKRHVEYAHARQARTVHARLPCCSTCTAHC